MRREREAREIGPAGTASRGAGGAAAIAIAFTAGEPGWWDVATAAVLLPVLAMAVAAGVGAAGLRDARGGAVVLALVIGAGTALTFVTPVDAGALWLFLGGSMLLAAARGDAGCEVVAVRNALLGRRDRVACVLYTPIDVLEARRRRPPAAHPRPGA